MKKLYTLICIFALVALSTLHAQTCWSGGTGADGAYLATSNTTLAGGTYNYTTFTIDPGVTVTVTGTAPLVIHCTGAVTINGTLSANGGNGNDGITSSTFGMGGVGVAGGGNGGDGVYSTSTGPLDGIDGIGAGSFNTHGNQWGGGGGAGYYDYGDSVGNGSGGFGGAPYGSTFILGGESGSGGGGGSGGFSCGGGGGGGGGGYLTIQSLISITVNATGGITSNGGAGGSDGAGNCGGGGGGSGGSIWLASPTVANYGMINVYGGVGGASAVPGPPYYGTGAHGSDGRVRVDCNGSVIGLGTFGSGYASLQSGTAPLAVNPTSTSVLCFGDANGTASANVSGGGGTITYSWSVPGSTATITGLVAGNYLVSATDGEFCTAAGSTTVTEPAPLTLTIVGVDESSSAANDGSATATGGGGTPVYTYNWAPSGGNAATATGLDAGTYTCTLTDSNGCTTTQTVTIGTMNGIANNNNEATISIFPNPSNGPVQLNVQLKDASVVRTEVYNTLGECVLTQISNSTSSLNETVDLSAFPSGIYSIRVSAGENQVSRNIVLQH